VSKRLSQKSSKNQFHMPGSQVQHHVQTQGSLAKSFSPQGRKLANLPAHVQQQLMMGKNGVVGESGTVGIQSQAAISGKQGAQL